jgi:DNA-binding transcriptional regulator YdaS (Cro superfamily)
MGIESTIDTPLAAAVRKVGSQSAYARLVGRSQSSIYERLRDLKDVPATDVLKVEAETGISRHVLRPDLYPDESGHDAALSADRRRPTNAGVMEPSR